MSKFTIVRVASLPSTITPSTMYILKQPTSQVAEVYFSNNDGSQLVPSITEQFITDKFASLLATGMGEIQIVDTINDRNRVTKNGNSLIMVIDATGDEFGSTGTVLYLYRAVNASYFRVSVFDENRDGVSSGGGTSGPVWWDTIQGKPASTPAQIDDAVSKAHVHSNQATLDRIGVTEDGVLTVDGNVFANIVMVDGEW